ILISFSTILSPIINYWFVFWIQVLYVYLDSKIIGIYYQVLLSSNFNLVITTFHIYSTYVFNHNNGMRCCRGGGGGGHTTNNIPQILIFALQNTVQKKAKEEAARKLFHLYSLFHPIQYALTSEPI
ncbi:hypothetical protein ACJX0J_015209, partial [Zea mays]